MKTSIKFLGLFFAALILSGCATPCDKNMACRDCASSYVPPVEAPKAAAPAAAVSAPVSNPVTPAVSAEPAEDVIPAAVRK